MNDSPNYEQIVAERTKALVAAQHAEHAANHRRFQHAGQITALFRLMRKPTRRSTGLIRPEHVHQFDGVLPAETRQMRRAAERAKRR